MGSISKKNDAETFESSMKNLEAILAELEDSKISLDDLVSKFAQAKDCLKFCRARLDSAELKIKKLSESGESDFDETSRE